MSTQNKTAAIAQVLIPTKELNEEITFFTNLGFRLDNIFPADDPAVAMLSGHSLHLRLDKNASIAPPCIHLLTDDPEGIESDEKILIAPSGTKIEIHPKSYILKHPPTVHKFEIRHLQDNDPWVIGRAGMLYRDLIPDRLGGSIIASHIRIPKGGPVPDMVHYHTIGFQLIYCYRGWVKLVYEDQGPAFILQAGDCVTQPPEIRHRVLESSDNLEVIEIGVPAEHMTTIDHEMELPTKSFNPEREFQGQKFCHHLSKEAVWNPWRINGFEYRNTGIDEATGGVASVHVARAIKTKDIAPITSHEADILFTFVLEGSMEIRMNENESHTLGIGDAYVIPPKMSYQLLEVSEDLELLEVALPGIT